MLSQGKERILYLKACPQVPIKSPKQSGLPSRNVATVKNSKATESSSRNEELFKLLSLSTFI